MKSSEILTLIRFAFYKQQDIIESVKVPVYHFNQDYDYCQAPLPATLKTETRTAQGTLSKVIIVHRHGDRTPVAMLPFAVEVDWSDCSPSDYVEFAIDSSTGWIGDCVPGQLTTKGRDQMTRLGQAFSQKYSDFLEGMSLSKIHLQSTDVWRTIESARALSRGMFPNSTVPIKVPQRHWDPLAVNSHMCASKAPKSTSIASKTFDYFDEKIRHGLKTLLNFSMTLEHYVDIVQARSCHQKPQPCELLSDPQCSQLLMDGHMPHFRELWREANYNISDTYVSQLGPLWSHFAKILKDDTSLYSFSAHDTTLSGLLTLFDSDSRWPGYAASFVIEVWENNGPHVSIGFNDLALSIPNCPSPCSLDSFLAFISPYSRDISTC